MIYRIRSRICTVLLCSAATPAALFAQATEAGRGALRPYVHVLLAYGITWVLIALWVWMIARKMKRLAAGESGRPANDGGA